MWKHRMKEVEVPQQIMQQEYTAFNHFRKGMHQIETSS